MSDLTPSERAKIVKRIAELDAKMSGPADLLNPVTVLEWIELYRERRLLRGLLGNGDQPP